MTTKAKREALEREFASSTTMTSAEFAARMAAINASVDDEPVAPDVFATIASVRSALETVAATVGPLLSRVSTLEQKLRTLEAKAPAMSISANDAVVDGLQGLGEAVAYLNTLMAQPIKPLYDSKGILIGARRVCDLDS